MSVMVVICGHVWTAVSTRLFSSVENFLLCTHKSCGKMGVSDISDTYRGVCTHDDSKYAQQDVLRFAEHAPAAKIPVLARQTGECSVWVTYECVGILSHICSNEEMGRSLVVGL